jgi:hypothetical protein
MMATIVRNIFVAYAIWGGVVALATTVAAEAGAPAWIHLFLSRLSLTIMIMERWLAKSSGES